MLFCRTLFGYCKGLDSIRFVSRLVSPVPLSLKQSNMRVSIPRGPVHPCTVSLPYRSDVGVVPREGVQGPGLDPAQAELLSGGARKATDVGPHVRHTKEAHVQNADDREPARKKGNMVWQHAKTIQREVR